MASSGYCEPEKLPILWKSTEFLVKNGANVNAYKTQILTDNDGNKITTKIPIIAKFALYDDKKCIEFLKMHGANVNVYETKISTDKYGNEITTKKHIDTHFLCAAISEGDKDRFLEILGKKTVDIHSGCHDRSMLQFAIENTNALYQNMCHGNNLLQPAVENFNFAIWRTIDMDMHLGTHDNILEIVEYLQILEYLL